MTNNVRPIRPRATADDLDPRTRRRYDSVAAALDDAENVVASLVDQLDVDLIPDPADVRFLARRAAALLAACQRAIAADGPTAEDLR